MLNAQPKCGARRPVAMQCTILRCHCEPGHKGDHIASTERGGLVSWPDGGKVRFWVHQRRNDSAA
jgi:hypothetical protein